MRTSDVLKHRRVCDAGPQTGLIHDPSPSDDRLPAPRPNIMPQQNKQAPLLFKLLFLHQCSPWDEAFPNQYAYSRVTIGWPGGAWRRIPLSIPGAKTRRPYRIFSHPAGPYWPRAVFEVVPMRTGRRRSSSHPGPAKMSCTPL